MAEQPREHDILCQRCFNARTWNIDATCDACKARAVQPHKNYAAVSGQPRPMDSTHGVLGDTPCVCGGIAWYHGADGCDDCAECKEFRPDHDWIIDGIRNTLLEAFDQTNDIDGPNWTYMARAVYEQHIAPPAMQALAIARLQERMDELVSPE